MSGLESAAQRGHVRGSEGVIHQGGPMTESMPHAPSVVCRRTLEAIILVESTIQCVLNNKVVRK
jgi:hypothetical protein